MARPKRRRRVTNPPHFKGFRPIGLAEEKNPIILNFEEYEAIRLSDFELYGQLEASQIMEVSRPTYTRIYESARRKIAQAFVEGRTIVFEGGKVYFDSEWHSCRACGCFFTHPAKDQEIQHCALCGSTDIQEISENSPETAEEDRCTCPQCGYEKEHTPGVPCKTEICPKCNIQMMRKGSPHHNRMRNNNRLKNI